MSIILRDVMNSKSDIIERRSINANDLRRASNYYAIESRIYMGIKIKHEEFGYEFYQKNLNMWFTNELVFDFDFDESHFPNIEDLEKELENSILKIKRILGNPKYEIYNKQEFSQYQMKRFFTKNGKLNMPKKYGAQLIYELDQSVQSIFYERVRLYNDLRNFINKETNADMNFRGHMHKNQFNVDLFNVVENQNYDLVNIFNKAKELNIYGYETDKLVSSIRELSAFKYLNSNDEPTIFKKLRNDLIGWYFNLNTYKGELSEFKTQNLANSILFKSESRNETLFEYLRSLDESSLNNITFKEIEFSNLFDGCLNTEMISESEFNYTKSSVIHYRKRVGFYDLANKEENNEIFDNRVLKLDFNKENKLDKNKLLNLIYLIETSENKIFYSFDFEKRNKKFKSKNKEVKSIKNKDFSFALYLKELFMLYGPIEILKNIKFLINQDIFDIFNQTAVNSLNNLNINIEKMKAWDLYSEIQKAIFYTHFEVLNSIKYEYISYENKEQELKNKISYFALNYRYLKTKTQKKELLKLCKKIKSDLANLNIFKITVTSIQNLYNIRRMHASIFRNLILYIDKKEEIKNIIENKINFYLNDYKNSSQKEFKLINIFIIVKKYILYKNIKYDILLFNNNYKYINNTE